MRTFATQLRLMEDHPEYRFACSQAQQYAWIRDGEPDLWERIRARIESGHWLPVGGTWIEPDCNLPAGESLVRQFVHGQRFFAREFGRRATVFWNPDVFGYNGQLPQIMRGAGITGFLTQKLSWNRFNPPEHHTFHWVGIDGSSVLAHFPPADTYNGEATVAELRRAARDFKDPERSSRSLLPFGWGDGGGGPTADMIETIARTGDLQGVPRTAMADPEAFFRTLAEEAEDWPEVVGELYLEYHRGTYTTQARTKRASRRAEAILHDAELLAALAGRLGVGAWPAEALAASWRTLLTCHFHDIIPGSSIHEVHERAERDLAEVGAAAAAVRDGALEALAGAPARATTPRRRSSTRSASSGARWWRRRTGSPSRSHRRAGSGGCRSPTTPSASRRRATASCSPTGTCAPWSARTARCARSCTCASGREAMAAPGNVLELYEDRPTNFEAWDLDPFHLETRKDCPPATRVEIARAEPLRAELLVERPAGARSTMRQRVRLDAEAHAAGVPLRRSTGARTGARLQVRFPVAVLAPRAPPTRCSSASSSGRRTPPPGATSPSTRCPGTASPTSPSTASASRCCPPPPTAGPCAAARCG